MTSCKQTIPSKSGKSTFSVAVLTSFKNLETTQAHQSPCRLLPSAASTRAQVGSNTFEHHPVWSHFVSRIKFKQATSVTAIAALQVLQKHHCCMRAADSQRGPASPVERISAMLWDCLLEANILWLWPMTCNVTVFNCNVTLHDLEWMTEWQFKHQQSGDPVKTCFGRKRSSHNIGHLAFRERWPSRPCYDKHHCHGHNAIATECHSYLPQIHIVFIGPFLSVPRRFVN